MITTSALVLHTYPILEKDMVVELFTKDVGRIRAFVKYAQSKKPRFGGLLNTMNYVLVELIKKKDTYYIRHIRLETEFVNLKKSYKKMALGYHFIRLTQSLIQYNQENDGLFKVMIQSFKELNLEHVSDLSALKKYVYHKILELEGIMPKHKVTLSEKDYLNLIQEYTHQIVKERL